MLRSPPAPPLCWVPSPDGNGFTVSHNPDTEDALPVHNKEILQYQEDISEFLYEKKDDEDHNPESADPVVDYHLRMCVEKKKNFVNAGNLLLAFPQASMTEFAGDIVKDNVTHVLCHGLKGPCNMSVFHALIQALAAELNSTDHLRRLITLSFQLLTAVFGEDLRAILSATFLSSSASCVGLRFQATCVTKPERIRTNELPNQACFQALFGNSGNSADFCRMFDAASFALSSEDRYNINAASWTEFSDDDLWKKLGLGVDLHSELKEAFSEVHKHAGQSVPDQMREIGWVLYRRCVDMALEAINNALGACGQEVVRVFCGPGFDCVRRGNYNDLFSNSLFESALSGFFRLAGLPETPALHALQHKHGILAVINGPKAVDRHIREAINSGMKKIQRETDLGPNANVLCFMEADLSLSLCHGMYQCFCNYRLALNTPFMHLSPSASGWRSVLEKSIYPCIRCVASDQISVINAVSYSNWRDKLREFNALTFHRCVVVLPSVDYILPTRDWFRLGKSITQPLSIPRPIFMRQYRDLLPATSGDLSPHIERLGLSARDDVVIFWTRKVRRDIRKLKSQPLVSPQRCSSPSSLPRFGTPSRRCANLDGAPNSGLGARFSPSVSSSPPAPVHMPRTAADAARVSPAADSLRAKPLYNASLPDSGRSHMAQRNVGEWSQALSCDTLESPQQGPLDVTFMSPQGIALRCETPRPLFTPRRTPSSEARVDAAVQAWITRSDTSPAVVRTAEDGETARVGEYEAPRFMLTVRRASSVSRQRKPSSHLPDGGKMEKQNVLPKLRSGTDAKKMPSRVCESSASYIQHSTDSCTTSTQRPSSTGARTSLTSTITTLNRPSTARHTIAPQSLISSQDTVHTPSSSRTSPRVYHKCACASSSSSAAAGPTNAAVPLNGSVSSVITLERTSAPMYSTSSTSSRDDGYVAGTKVRYRVHQPRTLPGVECASAVGSRNGDNAMSGKLSEVAWRTDEGRAPSVSCVSSISSFDRAEDMAERERRLRDELGQRERRLKEREKKLEFEERQVQLQQQAAQFKQKKAEDALAYVEAEARNLKKSKRELTQLKKQLRECLAAHARHDVAAQYNLPDPPDWAL